MPLLVLPDYYARSELFSLWDDEAHGLEYLMNVYYLIYLVNGVALLG